MTTFRFCSSTVLATALLAGCTQFEEFSHQQYDGQTDGLIAALGLTGLRESAPGYADATNPTVAELRRNTIYNNYRALVDESDAGGYGRLYGPLDDTTFAGHEYMAWVGTGINRATVMVQIPTTFDPQIPCLVAAPSSGSRGVYGAVGTTGEWALAKGCAVAYTDTNKGTGAVDLTGQQGFDGHGQLQAISDLGDQASFTLPTVETAGKDARYEGVDLPTEAELAQWTEDHPNRLAFKHAHSQLNIEKDWGQHTLEAIEYGFQVLNDHFEHHHFVPKNTLVIAASISNGGAAVLRAAEMDDRGWIDAVVAGEPQVNPAPQDGLVIKMPDRAAVTNAGKPLVQYVVESELYAACAGAAPAMVGKAFVEFRGDVEARCQALADAGFINAGSKAEMGAEALAKLEAIGLMRESLELTTGYGGLDIFQSLVATYVQALTRSSIVDSVCDVSFAAIDAGLTPAASPTLATLAAESNGIPRTSNIVPIKDDALGGPMMQAYAVSSNGQADYNFEAALCWYDILTNENNALYEKLWQGVAELQAHGDLQSKPTLIVHGRADAVVPVNHSSRAYYALNKEAEGNNSQTYYYEVTSSQHLDFLNPTYALFGQNYVPIDYYFKWALDEMWSHLHNGTALPPSQTIPAVGPAAGEPLMPEHVPHPVMAPGDMAISYEDGVLTIPK